jgi:hypothetical protein
MTKPAPGAILTDARIRALAAELNSLLDQLEANVAAINAILVGQPATGGA